MGNLVLRGLGETSDTLVLGGLGGGEEAPVIVVELSCDMVNSAEFEVEPDQRAATMTTGCDMRNGARMSVRAFRDSVSGAVPGSVIELYASRAKFGLTPGINSPLTDEWTDLSGNGNHGTLTGFGGETPWAGAGSVGDPYALQTSGGASGQVVVVAPSVSLPGDLFHGDAWAVETWVNLSDISTLSTVLNGTWHNPWLMVSDGTLYWRGFDESNTFVNMLITTLPAGFEGTWGHLVVAQDVPGGYLRIFINGELSDETTPVRLSASGATDFRWMNTPDGNNSFPGGMSLARIYPFAPTPEQVAQNYAAGPAWAPFSTGLPETDALGWTAPDAMASPLWDLTVTIAGVRIPNAAITSFPIELDAHGGFESCAISFASKRTNRWPRRAQIVVAYDGMHPFEGRLATQRRSIGTELGWSLEFVGNLNDLRNHRAFRRVYVDSDLDNWRSDQGPNTQANVFEVTASE